jgi:Ser/Thr protein kinase RdoA (MazF antagonist)
MERQIKERLNDEILQAAMQRYAIPGDQIWPMDAFESFIYEFKRDSQSFILRLGHSLRRTEALVQGEIDWINYLADHGVSVARAIYSQNGKLVEVVEDGQGGQFLAVAFVKVSGRPPWNVGWTPALYEAYGRLLGQMHFLTAQYQPTDPAWKRPDWDDELFEFVERYLPASEHLAKEKYRNLCAYLHGLPKNRQCYGLIHQDAHGSNMFVDQAGRLALFDFDDCAYSWFINDIAIALFYIALDADDPPTFTRHFMTHFLHGYRQVQPLDPHWLREIPNFLKLREIELYGVIHRDFDVRQIDDPWCARFMQGRKEKIENDIPFIDFDFSSLKSRG